MLFQREKKTQDLRKNCRDGEGAVLFEAFCQAESLPKPYRMFSEAVLEKGCSIGKHFHEDETEIYYVLEGRATIDDNGATVTADTGDMHVCYSGQYHSVKNDCEEPLRLLCVIARES